MLAILQVGRYHHPVARRFESGQQQQQQKSFNKVRVVASEQCSANRTRHAWVPFRCMAALQCATAEHLGDWMHGGQAAACLAWLQLQHLIKQVTYSSLLQRLWGDPPHETQGPSTLTAGVTDPIHLLSFHLPMTVPGLQVRYSQSGSDSQLGILQEQQGSSKYVDAKDLQIATLQLEKQLQQLEANLRAQLASKEDIKELKKELKESITFLTSGVAFIVLFLVASNLDKVQGWFK